MSEQTAEKTLERCAICRAPIQVINYALGPELMHYDPAASFPTESKGSAWRYCRMTMASRASSDPEVSR